ncbi:MAG: hypothetical protein WC222_03840 [Parachlamydiales bacterium]
MRSDQHSSVSKHLHTLSDDAILILLRHGTALHSRYGSSFKVTVDGIPLFVKQVPLNEVEVMTQNIRSTKNLFGLPVYYQYGVGSDGFSVWREVASHLMCTHWVLEGECENFPLLYHWRVLNNFQEKIPFDDEEFKKHVIYWENSKAIGERIKANYNASANVLLFLEYIPETLENWLSKEFRKGTQEADKAIAMVERNLLETAIFIKEKEMVHFDAHFQNILTDGTHLYFSDFGLATSSHFILSQEELNFFLIHSNYDLYYMVTRLTNWLVAELFGKEFLDKVLQEYAEGKTPGSLPIALTPFLSSIIKRYAPLTLKMNNFFETLTKKTKQTPYPRDELDHLWAEISF